MAHSLFIVNQQIVFRQSHLQEDDMKNTIIRSSLLVRLAVLLALPIMSSCMQAVPVTADLTIMISSTGAERSTLVPEGVSLEVESYIISGTGPQESTFTVTAGGPTATVSGLYVGNWTINVLGVNDLGTPISSGSTTMLLTTEDNTVHIDLYRTEGNGSFTLDVSWDTEGLVEPMLVVYLLDAQEPEGADNPVRIVPNQGGGTARFSSQVLPGSYTVQFILKSAGVPSGGCVKVLHVLEGEHIEYDIIIIPQLAEVSGIMILQDHRSVPVSGTVHGIPDLVYEGIAMHLEYFPDSSPYYADDEVEVTWYLNGFPVLHGRDAYITPIRGFNQLDIVAHTDKQGSWGAVSYQFETLPYDLDQDLFLVQVLSDDFPGIELRGVSDVITTADGYVAAAARLSSAVQVYAPDYSGILTVHQTLEDPADGILRRVRSLDVSGCGTVLAAVTDDDPTVITFTYDQITGMYSQEACIANSFELGGTVIQMGQLSDVAFAPNHIDLYVSDQGTGMVYRFERAGGSLVPAAAVGSPAELSMDSPRKLDVSPDGSRLAVACHDNSSLHLFSLEAGSLVWEEGFSYAYNQTAGISRIYHAVFASPDELFTVSNDFLCLFTHDGDSFSQTYRLKESDFDQAYLAGLRAVAVDQDRVYVANVSRRGVTVFDRELDGSLSYSSFSPCGPVHALAVDSANGYVYAVSTSEHELYVFHVTD